MFNSDLWVTQMSNHMSNSTSQKTYINVEKFGVGKNQ